MKTHSQLDKKSMSLQYYQHTLATIKKRLLARYPEAAPIEGATDDVHHTLWMIEQVPSFTDQGKIDRWIGWIGAKAHSMGLIAAGDDQITEARELLNYDKK